VTTLAVSRSTKTHGFALNRTDEQAPIPAVFDLLIKRVSLLDEHTDVLFNCQMGRGRTTTGMVIACVMEMIQYGLSQGDSTKDLVLATPPLSGSLVAINPGAGLGNNEMSLIMEQVEYGLWDEDDEDSPAGSDKFEADHVRATEESHRIRYLKGEYKIILQLLSVLPYGKQSKRLVDKAVDLCNHIQDIRGAIYDFKLRIEAIDESAQSSGWSSASKKKKYEALMEVGLNYLIRYFFLITFAAYLLEKRAGGLEFKRRSRSQSSVEIPPDNSVQVDTQAEQPDDPFPSFTAWLADRREILNICRRANQDFS
jgi:hypothetical protein